MDDDPKSKLEEYDGQLRSSQAVIDQCHLDLVVTATVILEDLHKWIGRTKTVSAALARLDAPWAQIILQRLQEAVRESEIKHGDREANMLLNLPAETEESRAEWILGMRLGDTNSGSLVAACRYASSRLFMLRTILEQIANDLSVIDSPQAKECAAQLLAK